MSLWGLTTIKIFAISNCLNLICWGRVSILRICLNYPKGPAYLGHCPKYFHLWAEREILPLKVFFFLSVCLPIIVSLGVISKKNPSIFKDIIQIEVGLPPSHPIFDKFIFYKVLIMLTSLPPLEFLTKIMTF